MAGPLFDLRHNAPDVAAALAKKPAEVLAALDPAFGRAAIELADAERVAAPKFRSELTNNILAGRKSQSPLEYQVIANSAHGLYVDEGTGAGGRPPLDQMLKWIDSKGITPSNPKMTVLDLARLFRMRIAQHGIKAQPFWEKTYDEKKDRIVELARAAAAQALGRAA